MPSTNVKATSTRRRVNAAERALLILKCFDEPSERLTLASLAQRSQLYKSTILRMIASLNIMGFIREEDGRYALGPELRRLGTIALSEPSHTLEEMLRPALRRLAKATKETASFYVLDGKFRLCLYKEFSLQPAKYNREEGTKRPLGRGAAGELLLHFAASNRKKGNDEIVRPAWAISRGGREPGLSAIAVPLFNSAGTLLGALTVSGLSETFTPSKFEKARRALQREVKRLRKEIA